MALFRFRTRSPDRDRQSDIVRFSEVRETIERVCQEIERERDGFRRRYDEASMDAAFSLENIKNEGETEKASAKIDDFAHTLERFSQRIASLEQQLAFFRKIDGKVADFAKGHFDR
jgi:predicted RNase H-like nuclease (RuvC/YqgF family)